MHTLRRTVAVLASSAVALSAMAITGPGTAATPSAAPSDPAPAAASAKWLVGELNADSLLEIASSYDGETFSGPSYGNSIDLALALSAVEQDQPKVSAITDAIAANLGSYAGSDGEVYSGSSAKALALAVDQKRDPATFGGVDLTSRVEDTVLSEAPVSGRLQDASAYGDYANSIGQAFAASALTEVGSTKAAAVTDYLLDQQCDAGFFRLYFNTDKSSTAQSCDSASPAEPAKQSPDTTAIVAIQLASLAAGDPEIKAALDQAGAWLLAQQANDGGFTDPGNGTNANTTGLAGWALAELGHDTAAAKAATWLRARQVVSGCDGKLSKEAGAVAYDDLGWTDGVTYGIADPLDRSQWVIAGVQALPALAAAPAATAKDAVTAAKFAKAGRTVTYTVTGLAAGERACVTGAAGTKSIIGTGKTLTVKLAKAKAGKRAVAVRSASGKVKDTVRVLGKKKFKVRAAKSAKAGSKRKVTVRGLAAGEKVTVKVRGKKRASGKANSKGVFAKKVSVGKKRGIAKVSVTGQYQTRKGATRIRVR
ncbi:prenyltransferase/squalene oxidase repeat-containing protein [Nocardioides gilvus]|uniref:prenyltransferase/squalene oxidase repeat-containing protein n=1 Tax=Nocardioides gilvus TaxID=1735589 RepID=UPI000D74E83A|nr:prenyltransferase/squalene oxidase repeat-containing protein [Nocardioides gilvus]